MPSLPPAPVPAWRASDGKTAPSSLQQLIVERAERGRFQRTQVVVERVDDQSERDVLLELGRAAVQDQLPAILAEAGQLGQQP